MRDAESLLQQNFSGKRMLVVDDEPVNCEIARMRLDDAGILMDMQMPNLNGLDATRQIREIPGYLQTPIIAMTAKSFAEDRTRCLDAGMNDFLIKPFEPDGLFATVLRAPMQRNTSIGQRGASIARQIQPSH